MTSGREEEMEESFHGPAKPKETGSQRVGSGRERKAGVGMR